MQNFYKLIVENDFNEYEVVKEAIKTGGHIIKLRGPYIVADKINGNGRQYPYEDLKPEVERFIEEVVNKNRALGELEHPNYAHINPERSAIRITSLTEENKTWVGESIVLASDPSNNVKGTPLGDILASLIQYDTTLGFSTRGIGKIENKTVKEYKISTIDCVSNPSIGEFVEGILESKNFLINVHGDILEVKYDVLENSLKNIPKKGKSDILALHIKNFIKGL